MISNKSFQTHSLIHLHDQWFLTRQTIAGKVAAQAISTVSQLVSAAPPNLTTKDLEETAVKVILDGGCTPTFEGYKGFPGKICISVNRSLVHGIPSNYILQPGDIVKVDLGATYDGEVVADTATTLIYSQPKSSKHPELIKICKEALNNAIKAIQIGKQMGIIGYSISKTISKYSGLGLVTKYGGHGISFLPSKIPVPHASPFVSNKSQFNEGVRIVPGMSFAIEPMVVLGDPTTRLDKDGWTVLTREIGAHEEHTIFVTEEGPKVMTRRTDEN